MNIIPRLITPTVIERLNRGDKVILIYGPRQVGKTTLVNEMLNTLPYRVRAINAD